MEQNKLQSAVEAILFALGVPVETNRLCQALETDRETVEAACRALAESYEARDAGIRLACLEDSWQLTSSAEWGEVIRALLSRRKARREGRSCCSEGCSACDKCSTADRRS